MSMATEKYEDRHSVQGSLGGPLAASRSPRPLGVQVDFTRTGARALAVDRYPHSSLKKLTKC
jgi:hypothetical protein